MDKQSERYLRVYPWFYGFSADLLFYIAIDTLFLTLVKGFSAAEIVSLTSFSHLSCLVLQFPILFAIRRLGNTVSVRIGTFLLLCASLLITFGESYAIVLLGKILKEAAVSFDGASVVALENNLDLLGRRDEFVRYRARATMTYSIITLLISVVASYLFNVYRYLPMLCCVATSATGFVLSLMLKDCSDRNRISSSTPKSRTRIRAGGLLVLVFVVYALFYLLVSNGQSEGKLFIQQQMLLSASEELTAVLIGVIVFASRLVRVLSNAVVKRLYERLHARLGVILTTLMSVAVCCLLFGSMIPIFAVKIVTMSLGYMIVLFSRDPFRLYIQDVLFASTPREQHQTLITALGFGLKLATAGVGLVYSAILVSFPMTVVVSIMLGISLVELALGLLLYRAILRSRASVEVSAS